MQQSPSMIPVMPSHPSNSITTEQIQRYLDENKRLILAIMDNQNLGKLAECAQYQTLLQKNLMYLAAIADAQPQTPTMAPQMAAHPQMQQGGYFMQHPQAQAAAAAAMAQQQSGLFSQKVPMQYNSPHQLHQQDSQMHLHHHHQMSGLRPNNALKQDGSGDGTDRHGHGSSAADGADD